MTSDKGWCPSLNGEDVFPFLLGALVFMIPIIAILTHHQRKMAELIHGTNRTPLPAPVDANVVNELVRLRELVAQQSIAIDNLVRSQEQMETKLSSHDTHRLNA